MDGESNCCGGGAVGERSALVGSVRLSPCSVILSMKSENRRRNCGRGSEGNLIPKKSSLTG